MAVSIAYSSAVLSSRSHQFSREKPLWCAPISRSWSPEAAHVRFTIDFVGSDGGDRSGGRAIDGGYNAVHFPSRGSRGISYPLDVNHYDASVNHAETIMVEPTKRSLPGLTIRFDPEVKAAIEKAAKADKRSASSLVEIAVIAYLREKGFVRMTGTTMPAKVPDRYWSRFVDVSGRCSHPRACLSIPTGSVEASR